MGINVGERSHRRDNQRENIKLSAVLIENCQILSKISSITKWSFNVPTFLYNSSTIFEWNCHNYRNCDVVKLLLDGLLFVSYWFYAILESIFIWLFNDSQFILHGHLFCILALQFQEFILFCMVSTIVLWYYKACYV